ncbi:protein phosphatase pp2a regulatory subunit a [Histomonas meleagridis]|uniref:protein phosphatase pp2a regulatory subunit a n=1 Tax=Histomonas meleagridis TaxID=135588 RepID=UPI00355986A2|nr:protein phosphatase pp2a regulatory subunit a [Histomonas meleagridis]KAH0805573.1 protein phosphatase pp2a regulatory subunit a [Histomonas meleagridis]
MPRNCFEITSPIAEAIPQLAKVTGNISSLSSLIEALLSSEDEEISEIILPIIEEFKNDPSIDELISNLSSSKYDFVRVFCTKIILFSANNSLHLKFFQKFIADESFLVRFALAQIIPKVEIQHAKVIAVELSKDTHSRIRAYIPVACSKMEFFLTEILPTLVNDPDWSVRSSLATHLVEVTNHSEACDVAIKLINDSVWQVKYCALKSLTTLLKEDTSFEFTQGAQVLSLLSKLIRSPQYPLKIAVIDNFFAIANRCKDIPIDQLQPFSDSLVSLEKSNIKLHFIEEVAKSGNREFAKLVSGNIDQIVNSLSKDDQWRVRLGIAQQLCPLSKLLSDTNCKPEFFDTCMKLTEDEAHPVRMAAIHNLVVAFLMDGPKIPECISQMSQINSFRRRQAALEILSEMRKNTDNQEFKDTLMESMKPFLQDSCRNVALLAKKLIEEAEAK